MAPKSKCSWCHQLLGDAVGKPATFHREKNAVSKCPGVGQPTVPIK